MSKFPRVALVEQKFSRPKLDSVQQKIVESFANENLSLPEIQNKRVAIAVGSRGITNLAQVVRATAEMLKKQGAHPFIVPAMGSHGGGTKEGQAKILTGYGITPEQMGVPVHSCLETVHLGATPDGVSVFVDRTAFESDGIVLINRIKPHTDFQGEVESGLLKMITIGLGKIDGANSFHGWTLTVPHDHLIQSITQVVLETGKILFGIAILENAYHEIAQIELIPAAQIKNREKELLLEAKKLMPSLPVEKADVLIIDRIGKDISGAGMDPNITGRWFRVNSRWQESPDITRIVVLDLTDSSEGNAVGIGLADFCSPRLVQKMDRQATYLNAVTSRNTVPAQIPLYFDDDQETIGQAFASLGGTPTRKSVRLIRIRDTLSLSQLEVSEALVPELENHPRVSNISDLKELSFDTNGQLLPLGG
ncbi:nickel-dependent lactate racemase [Acidobacteria bacterium AH-259-G07]|nr:nickel-dependent lactate racemase [Acidobacteria bacterium AH-259-G07]